LVILKSAAAQEGVFRTSTMVGNNSKPAATATALTANLIQSIDAAGGGGFTVGSNTAVVNANATMHYWVAFKAGKDKMAVGTYTGDGNANKAISGIGFSPELVFIMAAGAQYAIHRSIGMPTGMDFEWGSENANYVTSLDTDGFTVGSDTRVNSGAGCPGSCPVYHYVAFNESPDYMDVGSYSGNGLDNQDLLTGFSPEYVFVKRTLGEGVHRPASLDQGVDSSLFFRPVVPATLRIKSLLPNGFRRGTTSNVNSSGSSYVYYAWKRESESVIATGDYDGTGAAQSITGIAFQPDVVIVKNGNATTNRIAVIRTNTMANGKLMTGLNLPAQTITSLDPDGFTVGTNANANVLTAPVTNYHFIAFKAAPSTMKVGTYTGNGGTLAITGVGFSPELVFVMPEAGVQAVHRSSASTSTFNFVNDAGTAGVVSTLDTDGFTVVDPVVNTLNAIYHYIAWNEIPGEMKVGTYGGDGGTAHNIGLVGFEPEYVIVRTPSQRTVQHPASLGRSIDMGLYFSATVGVADTIQTLQPDGFQVGTLAPVNTTATTYFYYAWKRPEAGPLTAVRLTSLTATRYDRGVLVDWKTGYEIDNLGFHVYREVNGERTRVTRSMIAGSGLMAGKGTAVDAEQHYAVWDIDPAIDPSAVYWLEDLDFNGTSTFNGPVTPVDRSLQAPPTVVSSRSLHEIGNGRGQKRRRMLVERGGRVERRVKAGARKTAPLSSTDMQRALAAQFAIKIGVDRPGWYRVAQPDLVAAGLASNVDGRTLRLFVDGVEQAIAVTGEADGRFDAADAIEFYATGVDTPYADTRTYWLTTDVRPGKRITVQPRSTLRAQAVTRGGFDFTLQQKERFIYFAALRNGDEENWFGDLVSEEPLDLVLELSNLEASGGSSAELEVTLQGVTDNPSSTRDHLVGVRVNGTEIGEVQFDGQASGVQSFPIPAGLLAGGSNTVTFVARGGEEDISLVDNVRLRYAHAYRADADLLRFTAEGGGTIAVGGFASKAIRVVDITDPLASDELRGTVGADGGLWALTLRVGAVGPRTLLAFTDTTVSAPMFVRANRPSKWYAASNAADYVVVSHANFAGALAPLVARRTRTGLTVAQVDIEDVYDEFSFGEKTPYALRDFVTRARDAWQKKPRFLLLVGDATLDPRDYDGQGDADFVPTKQIPMAQVALETASDDWFADADDDGLPELAVGRFSVRTAAQAEAMVAKVLDYEDGDGLGWNRRVLLVAGQNDEKSADFDQSVAVLHALVPSDYTVKRVISGAVADDIARVQVLDAVNEGQLIINYTGHGSVRVWGREALLTSEDVSNTWLNAGRLPLVVSMNCLNGFFHGIYDEESLAETLLRTPGGGAVAAWASSGVTDSNTHTRVNQELFRLLFSDPALSIGQAAAAAKRVVSDRDVRRTWIFFGDPALRLKGVPQLPAPTSTSAPPATVVVVPPVGPSVKTGTDKKTLSKKTSFRLPDWNGDGRADLFMHAGTGWQAILTSRTGNRVQTGRWTTDWEVYPADLNGDGIGDMVLLDRTSGALVQALHDGKGNFELTESALPIGALAEVHVADLNGDRLDDLLLTTPEFGSWQTGLNDGHGHFNYRAGSWLAASSITVADFNGDRRADAFLYDTATGFWTLAFSNRAGDFTSTSGQWTPGWAVQRANLDGDARADLVLYSAETGAWAECVTQDAGQFAVRRGVWAAGLTVLPLENEGRRDDILLYRPATGAWSMVMQPSGATVVAGGTWRPELSITTGDLDGDGRGDLFLYDRQTGVWMRGLRSERGPFEFSTGELTPGWQIATRP
jgi:hypothetical protein